MHVFMYTILFFLFFHAALKWIACWIIDCEMEHNEGIAQLVCKCPVLSESQTLKTAVLFCIVVGLIGTPSRHFSFINVQHSFVHKDKWYYYYLFFYKRPKAVPLFIRLVLCYVSLHCVCLVNLRKCSLKIKSIFNSATMSNPFMVYSSIWWNRKIKK